MIQNPIIRGFNPDPSIIRVGDDYYIVNSTFEWFPGYQIHHSKDLKNWKLVSRPLDRASQLDMRGVPDSGGVWAPWEERTLSSNDMIPIIQKQLDQQPGLQSFAFNPPSLPGASGNTAVEFILKTQEGYDRLYGVVQQVLAKARESGQFPFNHLFASVVNIQ